MHSNYVHISTIQGNSMDIGATASDYVILLDMTTCNDLELISNRISCQPPDSEDDVERSGGGNIPVIVSFQKNKKQFVKNSTF